MPILAPDRNKKKIAGVIMSKIMPTMHEQMRMGSERNVEAMASAEGHEASEETAEAGAMALRAMFSAAQDGDYEMAFKALQSAVSICESMSEGY